MITLAFDTSTTHGSVALLAEGAWLLEETFVADRNHSSTLFAVLERARALTPRLDQIAVGLGPGSFAGVRIAIAAALGFELALGARLVGLPSVAALEVDPGEYLTIGDARRDTFYFTHVHDGLCLQGPLLATAEALHAHLQAHPSLPVFTSVALPGFPTAQVALPSATRLARLAATERGITMTGDLEPIYLREPHITWPKARPA